MKDYAGIDNVTGSFPNVEAQNTTGPGATDGTPYIKQVIDDQWGARQALMDEVGATPNAADEAVGNSQFLEALKTLIQQELPQSYLPLKNWFHTDGYASANRYAIRWVPDPGNTYREGIFIAVGNDAVREMTYSNDGRRWSGRTVPTNENLYGVFGTDTIAVAVGNNGAIVHSTDPTANTWVDNSHGSDDLKDVYYGNGYWVACGMSGDIWTASDPTGTWTHNSSTPADPGADEVRAVIYVADLSLWIAVGDKSGTWSGIMTATDPTGTWTERTNPIATCEFFGITWDGTKLIAVGGSDATRTDIAVSADGITWTDKSSSSPQGGDRIWDIASDQYGRSVMLLYGGLYLTEDSADTWELTANGLSTATDTDKAIAYSEYQSQWVEVSEDEALYTLRL